MAPSASKKGKFENALEALRSKTIVVADTGDVAAMETYKKGFCVGERKFFEIFSKKQIFDKRKTL